MKIVDVRVKLLSADYGEGHAWQTGLGPGHKRDMVLVFVDTDEGLTGVGEAYHAFSGARAVESLILHSLRPVLMGEDPLNIDRLWHKMFVATIGLGSAAVISVSGVDIALWDILGRVTNQPIAALLGAGGVERIPAYVGCHTLGHQDPESLVEEAKGYAADGYKALKVRGGAGVSQDIVAVQSVREALGDEIDIMIDANSAYSWTESVELARKLTEYNVFWFEDPFDYTLMYHHEEIGRLRKLSSAPVSSGGNLFTRFDYRNLISHGGVDYITPDAVKCGGISECIKIAHMASAFGQLVGLHTVVGLGQFANVHVAAAIPEHVLCYVEWDPSNPNPLRDDIFTDPLQVEDGCLVVPQGAGIGTEVKLDAVDEYPFIDGPEMEHTSRRRRWQVDGT